jgi:subtilisin-like proprotein convertase family protein
VLSFSDAYEDDTVPAEPLSAFKGRTSAATWSLRAYDNAAGTEGKVDNWELELW